jgi:hypothetical protein
VEDFGVCHNGRDHLLAESISAQKNLSYRCWIALLCLTKLADRIDGKQCRWFFRNRDLATDLQTCESLTEFPTIPVLFGHVRFLYRKKKKQPVNSEVILLPDYICYDEKLCDFLPPTFRNGSNTCRVARKMGIVVNMEHEDWLYVIDSIKPYFRGCSIRHTKETKAQHASMYHCKNSSKYIFKQRIVDGISHCSMHDDETEVELSCSVDDRRRFEYPTENKCRSPFLRRDPCLLNSQLKTIDEVSFKDICDRRVHMLPQTIGGQNHSAETDCEHCPCSNVYTRCDYFWNCPHGEDEQNCTRPHYPPRTLACVSPHNYRLICLPAHRVDYDKIDCLGAADELQYCRSQYSYSQFIDGFRCLNDTQCIASYGLCDKSTQCPLGDDVAFCKGHRGLCYTSSLADRTDVEDVLCQLDTQRKKEFSLITLPIYPLDRSRKSDSRSKWPAESDFIAWNIIDEPKDQAWSWRYNRGLYARLWLGDRNNSYACFCPPSYYGRFCQYQNQRVSLSLRLTAIDLYRICALAVTLINEGVITEK